MLPKADLHLHQEWSPRLDRVLARWHARPAYDWHGWRRRLVAEHPSGIARLQRISQATPAPAHADTEVAFLERITDTLEESAAAGSHYTELRFDHDTLARPGFMKLFRLAESRVRGVHPHFHAEPVVGVPLWHDTARLFRMTNACAEAAAAGLAGIDLLQVPYTTEADWRTARQVAADATAAGLGVTVHAGEFSAANIAAVAEIDGVTRIGHAVHAVDDPGLLRLLAQRRITVEVCLSANVVLGAVPDLASHPLPRLTAAGVPVALGTDNPVQFGSTIDGEYRLAAALGLSDAELTEVTADAVRAGFTTPARRARILAGMHQAADVVTA
ncbi:adenosine deaminase [Stackebrandtia albiflava]|uniref:adenosine deaminase n=1 Tax=Stackebrandtia albiflava TaxID=406432 RepID=A0A562VBE5_9ACTN|nr:hypothetical protein [Stackebrandtia albiflava]TWJ15203.1 adenosine deaminase [Stackebrandtia albiflava]